MLPTSLALPRIFKGCKPIDIQNMDTSGTEKQQHVFHNLDKFSNDRSFLEFGPHNKPRQTSYLSPKGGRGHHHVASLAIPLVEQPQPVSPPFPEGGLQAWSTVFGAYVSITITQSTWPELVTYRFMIVFCTLGVTQSFGVYQDYYTVGKILPLFPELLLT